MDLIHNPLDGLTDKVDRREKELQDLTTEIEFREPLVKPVDRLTNHLGDLEYTRVDPGERWEQRANNMRSNREDYLA